MVVFSIFPVTDLKPNNLLFYLGTSRYIKTGMGIKIPENSNSEFRNPLNIKITY
jgi:hypothetical protein